MYVFSCPNPLFVMEPCVKFTFDGCVYVCMYCYFAQLRTGIKQNNKYIPEVVAENYAGTCLSLKACGMVFLSLFRFG